MKKTIALLLTVLLGLTVLSIPVVADAPEPRDPDDYLTIYYDFEGDTQAEQLRDKATAGSSADSLRIDSGDDGRFLFENGTVQNLSVAHPTLIADPSADLKQVNEGTGGTWYLRFKINEQSSRDVTLLFLRNTAVSRAFHLSLMLDGKLQSSTVTGTAPSGYVNPFSMPLQYTLGEWINLVCVRKVVNQNGADYNMIYYYAASGDPTSFANYTYLGRLNIGKVADGLAPSEGLPLYLFNYDNQTTSQTAKFQLDEVRFYCTDLTEAEVGALFTDTPEATPNPEAPPADTTPPTDDTTDTSAEPEPSHPETDPPQIETVDPSSGGKPTTPTLPEATTEEPVPMLPFPDDLEAEPNETEAEAEQSESGCNAGISGSWLWALMFGVALALTLKQKEINGLPKGNS